MRTVPTNILMLAIRLLLLPGSIWLVAYTLYRLVRNDYAGKPSAIIYVGLFFFIMFLIFNILSLLGVFKIRYTEDNKEITFHYLFKSRTILTNDISAYFLSTLKTKWKNYPGYILLLKDGSTIEVTEYNVKPLRDFYAFIVKSGVPCIGTKNSWYPLKRRLRPT